MSDHNRYGGSWGGGEGKCYDVERTTCTAQGCLFPTVRSQDGQKTQSET